MRSSLETSRSECSERSPGLPSGPRAHRPAPDYPSRIPGEGASFRRSNNQSAADDRRERTAPPRNTRLRALPNNQVGERRTDPCSAPCARETTGKTVEGRDRRTVRSLRFRRPGYPLEAQWLEAPFGGAGLRSAVRQVALSRRILGHEPCEHGWSLSKQ